jgi:hypothetical protein
VQPTPSGIDLREWQTICARKCHQVFVIVGIVSDWVGVGCGESIRTADPNDHN